MAIMQMRASMNFADTHRHLVIALEPDCQIHFLFFTSRSAFCKTCLALSRLSRRSNSTCPESSAERRKTTQKGLW